MPIGIQLKLAVYGVKIVLLLQKLVLQEEAVEVDFVTTRWMTLLIFITALKNNYWL